MYFLNISLCLCSVAHYCTLTLLFQELGTQKSVGSDSQRRLKISICSNRSIIIIYIFKFMQIGWLIIINNFTALASPYLCLSPNSFVRHLTCKCIWPGFMLNGTEMALFHITKIFAEILIHVRNGNMIYQYFTRLTKLTQTIWILFFHVAF